jgi:uncharacterized protein DUF1501
MSCTCGRHDGVTRRQALGVGLGGFLGFALGRQGSAFGGGALQSLLPGRGKAKSAIVIWLGGGASQFETWDPKVGRETGGPTKEIETSVPGVRIAEHLPKTARVMDKISIVRSMTGKEGDHDRATYYSQTGYVPGPMIHPALGSMVAKEVGDPNAELPNFVALSIANVNGAGFLPPDYAPLKVRPGTPIPNAAYPRGLSAEAFRRRMDLIRRQDEDFLRDYACGESEIHGVGYDKADRLIHSPLIQAFDYRKEDPKVIKAYDAEAPNTQGHFYGQACLIARRLVESGVKFVQISVDILWDHHKDIFTTIPKPLAFLDSALSGLVRDLDNRGMLESTLVLCMGEFGRTPKINKDGGRDHYPRTWSLALAGGGIEGGRVVGSSDADGVEVKDRPVRIPDLLATVYRCLGVDPSKKLPTPMGGVKLNLTDQGAPIKELLT